MKNTLKILALAGLVALGFVSAADASVLEFQANLLGSNEVPSTGSPATGLADILWDTSLNTMEVKISFSGLLGTTTASHIHCCLASPFLTGVSVGVATVTPNFLGFPLGVTSGTYDHTFDMTLASSYNPAFITANGGTAASAESVLFAGIVAGETYLNIHTSLFPSGEIRGFLVRVPEPGSLALMLGGLFVLSAGVFGARRGNRAS